MARINIEDSIYQDKRFHKLVALVGGDVARALGELVMAWALAQKWFTKPDRMIPVEEWEKRDISPHLLTADLAVLRNGKIYIRGAEDQFGWLIQRQNAGRKNKGKSRERPKSDGNGSERTESSFSFSDSFSSSDSHTPSQTQNKKKHKTKTSQEISFFEPSTDEEDSQSADASGVAVKSLGSQIFESYREAILLRWKAVAPRNGMVNKNCALIAKRIGRDAIEVAKFYVSHNDGLYVRHQHPVNLFLRDAESLHVQWQRGRAVTTAEVRSFEKSSQAQSQLERIRSGEL